MHLQDNEGHAYKWFKENRSAVSIPKWDPRPVPTPEPLMWPESPHAKKGGAGWDFKLPTKSF